MKKNRIMQVLLIGAIILVGAIVGVVALRSAHRPSPAVHTVATPPDATTTYKNAAAEIVSSGNYQLHVKTKKVTTMGDHFFSESSDQILTCVGLNTDDAQFQLEETVTHGGYRFSLLEQYSSGNAYITLDHGRFSAPITQEAYLQRQVPVNLIDPDLYGSVASETIEGKQLIGFSEPSAAETWAVPASATLDAASGRVILDADSHLEYASYMVSYLQDAANVQLQVEITPEAMDTATIPALDETASYIPVDSLEIPRLLEHASGYLQQTDTIQSQKQETIFCQAGNLRREQTTNLSMVDKNQNPHIEVDSQVNLIDYNQGGSSKKITQKEIFENGVYTIASEDATMAEKPEITEESMILYAQNILVGTIIMPEHIVDISENVAEHSYVLIFNGSEELAQYIQSEICQILYQDPDLLSQKASSYQTEKLQCTLEINADTGLPMSSGINYVGIHVIDGTSYTLESQSTQTYEFLN